MQATTSLSPKCLSTPFVVGGCAKTWPAMKWTVDTLAEVLGDKTLRCRLMPRDRDRGSPAWESEGLYVQCHLHQFRAWSRGEAGKDNPLAPFPPRFFSGYIDYKYLRDVFANLPHKLKEVQWRDLGLEGIDGEQSTIWVGSSGASTPCHFDTYGFNLVLQVEGSKQWVLFPPSDSECLYPTRIPYEESSVFSQVDLAAPNIHRFPKFQNSHPIVITLEPGQILYVPRHWWHYVSCSSTAVSINTWVDIPEDNSTRVSEAVTRMLASSLIPNLSQTAGEQCEQDWVNPTEELESVWANVEYLKTSILSLKEQTSSSRAMQHQGSIDDSINADKYAGSSSDKTAADGSINDSMRAEQYACSSSDKTAAWLSSQPRLSQLYRTLQNCPVYSVQSPFCLSQQQATRGQQLFPVSVSRDQPVCDQPTDEISEETPLTANRKRKNSDDSECPTSKSAKCMTQSELSKIEHWKDSLRYSEGSPVHNESVIEESDGRTLSAITVWISKPCDSHTYLSLVADAESLTDSSGESDRDSGENRVLENATTKVTGKEKTTDMVLEKATQKATGKVKKADLDGSTLSDENQVLEKAAGKEKSADTVKGDNRGEKQKADTGYLSWSDLQQTDVSVFGGSVGENMKVCASKTKDDNEFVQSKLERETELGDNSTDVNEGKFTDAKLKKLEECLLKSVLHPDVVALITRKLLENIKSSV